MGIGAILTDMSRADLIRRGFAAASLLVVAAATIHGDTAFTRRDADSLHRKLVQIGEAGVRAKAARALSTTITEPELNAYLRYHAAGEIPAGVTEPYITIVGDGKLEGRATVDLDVIRRQKQREWTDPLGYVTGRVPVQAAGALDARDGIGRFTLESATIGGVPVPKSVLQELVSYYSRSAQNPTGVSLDAPFELPARIREIRVGQKQATVIQ
jgi:hypothetical protein